MRSDPTHGGESPAGERGRPKGARSGGPSHPPGAIRGVTIEEQEMLAEEPPFTAPDSAEEKAREAKPSGASVTTLSPRTFWSFG